MRTFIGFGQSAYIGVPQAQAIKLGGISGQAIPLLVQWLSYGASTNKPNVNILVDISLQPCVKLDQIRSVYIDNLGSDNPVYVHFPDTGYNIVAKPNSEGWYPAYTNARQIWVVGEGFLTGDIPQTYIILSNIFMPPAVNVEIDQAVSLWKASATITRGNTIYNSNFGVPALGDQFFVSGQLQLDVAGNSVNMWNTPYSSGFLYITSLSLFLFDFSATPGVGLQVGQLSLESTGSAGVLITPRYAAFDSTTTPPTQGGVTILNLSGLQIKLDASQTWRLRTALAVNSGGANAISSFTTNPS